MTGPQIALLIAMVICLISAMSSKFLVEALPDQNFIDAKTLEIGFTGFMAILASVLGLAHGVLRTRLALSSHVESLETGLPGISVNKGPHSSQPLEKIIILPKFPAFTNERSTRDHIFKACMLANYLPVMAERISDLDSFFKDPAVMALIADESFLEDIVPYLSKRQTVFFSVRPAEEHLSSNQGSRIRVTFPNADVSIERISKLADVLTPYHGIDTPRGVGFHGNWCGTYGLMALKQKEDLTVTGVYWYGRGTLTGHCEIDVDHHRLLLHYQWSQSKGISGIGSGNSGHGIFSIPAGHNFLYGYWCPEKEESASQGWSAARVSGDITANILEKGDFGTDLGLSQHPRENLVGW